MHARKIKYDESFIAKEGKVSQQEQETVQAIGENEASYVPSPARKLQQQIEDQMGDTVVSPSTDKYGTIASVAIIVGISLALWTGVATISLVIF
ncbi:MAG: hypothetical protein ABJO01_01965 [Parasphingorhabdus sp.]|uniref:hypothetical protein n=1 Tax=Parasphingorhabdus sp. TaxID=2709688 RepID=UPI0032980E9D